VKSGHVSESEESSFRSKWESGHVSVSYFVVCLKSGSESSFHSHLKPERCQQGLSVRNVESLRETGMSCQQGLSRKSVVGPDLPV
jgi:hypothetical protein